MIKKHYVDSYKARACLNKAASIPPCFKQRAFDQAGILIRHKYFTEICREFPAIKRKLFFVSLQSLSYLGCTLILSEIWQKQFNWNSEWSRWKREKVYKSDCRNSKDYINCAKKESTLKSSWTYRREVVKSADSWLYGWAPCPYVNI